MKILIISIAATFVAGFLLTAVATHGAGKNENYIGGKAGNASTPQKDYFGGKTIIVTSGAEGASGTSTPFNDGENEVEEDLDPNAKFESPGFESHKSAPNISHAQRCVEWAPRFDILRQKFCPEVSVPFICAVWDRENNMRLGDARGEHCKASSAGAQGCFQFMPGTAKTFGRDGDSDGVYNPQSVEDGAASALVYLCALKKKVGEQYMYRSYNAGPGYYDTPGEQAKNTISADYDAYIRGHAQMYAAALEGKMDMTMPTGGTTMLASISTPVPIGECWISAVYGEPRPRRNGTHIGMDMACPLGTKVLAIADCKVVLAGEHNTEGGKRAGKQVQCAHGNGSAGTLALSWYFHLDSVTTKTGDTVKAGQQIGTVGSTGTKDSAVHLHFQSYLWTGSGGKPTICQFPGIWFPTIPFLPNATNGRYKGPQTPGAARAAAKFERMFAAR